MSSETYADQRAHDVTRMTAAERAEAEAEAPRFAIEARGWRWTYGNITASEAHKIAGQLTAGSGEQWEVRELAAERVDVATRNENSGPAWERAAVIAGRALRAGWDIEREDYATFHGTR